MRTIYEYVIEELSAAKGSLPKVAKESGVPLRSLEKIARKVWRDPSVHTIQKLATYFQSKGNQG